VLSRPDMADFARTALQPSMPVDSGVHSPMLVLIAIVSGAIGSMGNLKYSAYVHEKRWRSLDHLRSQRLDLAISMFAMLVMLALIQVAAAGALRPRGLEVADIKDLVPIFAQVLGGAGQILFGVTLWCVVFSQHITSGAAYGIMVSDVYHRFMRKSEELVAERVAPSQLPAYRWMVLYACLSPLYVFATDWSPVGMVLGYGLISIIGLPVIAGMVIALTSNRKVMGEHVNGWFTNIVLSLTVISAIYVSWEGVLDLMKTLRKV
jgi:Mn2+/Fe2+ NRAMP family transporter